MATYHVWLSGNPRPKGSMTPGRRRDGSLFVRHASGHVAAWCRSIGKQAPEKYNGPVHAGPVHVGVTFFLERGKTVKRKYPCAKGSGDVDKLIRGVLDAFTGVAYVDDVQVVSCSGKKLYTDGEPGAAVIITDDEV